ncbi:MAG: hypothetical protein ACLR8U_13250 [Oscillospiraceae bacterium]|nr:hypothetical protein [Bacillota bacterium]
MKKWMALFLCAILILSLCACGGGSGGGGSSSRGSSSSRCTICGKAATHTFQGSGYCDRHYNDAVTWAIDNVAEKSK